MKVVGLIVEYNPFHNGHLYHLESAKKITGADYIICVMSGNFVQRGEPAILNKWARTQAALESGADLVIELPVLFATASAEYFARAAVTLLNDLGVVDSLCFGSESGVLQDLDQIADLLCFESHTFKKQLNQHLKTGLSFPQARALTLQNHIQQDSNALINTANNILGIEYLKALKRLDSPIQAYTIKRFGAHYHDKSLNVHIASASAIRQGLKDGYTIDALENQMPVSMVRSFKEHLTLSTAPVYLEDFFTLLRYVLLKKPLKELKNIMDVTEGLENRFVKAMSNARDLKEFMSCIGTKRYTNTKLQRALLHILLDLKQETFHRYIHNGYSCYSRVLGFREKSSPLLKAINLNSKLPLIVNVNHAYKGLTSLQQELLQMDIDASDLYNTVVLDKFGVKLKSDYQQEIIRI